LKVFNISRRGRRERREGEKRMAINSKSTKAEILEAYKASEKEKKALELEIKKGTQTSSKNVQSLDKTVKVNDVVNMIQNQVNQRDISKIINILEQLHTGFGSAVSNLSEQLIAEATTWQDIQEAINKEKEQLVNLHELTEVEENTIDNLLAEYQESNKHFAEKLSEQQENAEQEIEELQKTWAKEKELHYREIKERNENYYKTKQRETEEYQYNLDLQRDLADEEYEQRKQNLYKKLVETRLQLEKQWQQREESISKKEKEYAEAKEKVEIFEAQLKAKIKQGEEEGKGIGTYQAKVKGDLREKEIEGEKQNYQLRIQNLEQTITNQETRINKLSQQLDAALKQVQDLAVKAIEGTSNRKSFEAMKEIALEQAKTQQKAK
jgi:hypothetical protein